MFDPASYTIIPLKSEIKTSSLGPLDHDVTIPIPRKINQSAPSYLYVHSLKLSRRFPNVYDRFDPTTGTLFKNDTIRLTVNGGGAWTTMTYPAGTYDANTLTLGIRDIFNQNGWLAVATDDAIKIETQGPTGKSYIIIDSSKLSAPGQAGIDLTGGGTSTFYELLGFNVGNTTFITDSPTGHISDNDQKIDSVGKLFKIRLNLQGNNLGYFNGRLTRDLAVIDMSSDVGKELATYPPTGTSVYPIPINLNRDLDFYSFEIKNDLEVQTGVYGQAVFLSGEFYADMSILQPNAPQVEVF